MVEHPVQDPAQMVEVQFQVIECGSLTLGCAYGSLYERAPPVAVAHRSLVLLAR